MKMFLKYLAAACFSFSLMLAPALFAEKEEGEGGPEAHEMGPDHGKMMEKMGEKMKEKLGLSDAQFKKFQEANKANQEVMKPLREKQKELMEKLNGQVEAKAKETEIQATLDEASANQKAIQVQQEKHRDSLKEILTPTQQAKAVLGMRKMMKAGMGDMKGMKKGMGKGKWSKDKKADKE